MPIRNTTERWGWVSISIHWLTVLMVLSLIVVGLLMQEMANSPTKIQVASWTTAYLRNSIKAHGLCLDLQ